MMRSRTGIRKASLTLTRSVASLKDTLPLSSSNSSIIDLLLCSRSAFLFKPSSATWITRAQHGCTRSSSTLVTIPGTVSKITTTTMDTKQLRNEMNTNHTIIQQSSLSTANEYAVNKLGEQFRIKPLSITHVHSSNPTGGGSSSTDSETDFQSDTKAPISNSNPIIKSCPPPTPKKNKKSLIQANGIERPNGIQKLKETTDITVQTTNTNSMNQDELSKPDPALWVAPAFDSDLIVVLDMDECLIHAQFIGNTNAWSSSSSTTTETTQYRQYEAGRPNTDISTFINDDDDEQNEMDPDFGYTGLQKRCDSFRITLPDGDLVHINKRPHLSTFLNKVCATFETYIFTAAVPIYAGPVLDVLDPKQEMLQGRFYRENCSHDLELGVYVKDLRTVLDHRLQQQKEHQQQAIEEFVQEKEQRIVLIDNNPLSFIANPSNGILVSNFYDDPTDETLPAVLDLLYELDRRKTDVRPHLDNLFGLKDALHDVLGKR